MSGNRRQLSHFKQLVVFAVPFLLLTIGSLSHDAQAQPPSFEIASLQAGGTGCPQGTVTVNVAPNLQSFTLLFDDYGAKIPFKDDDPTKPPQRADRENCAIVLGLKYDPGFRFAIVQVNYEGGTQLQNKNVVAKQQSTYRFQGQGKGATASTTWKGPIDELFLFTDIVKAPVFSPCGAVLPLQINTVLTVNNFKGKPTDFGSIAQDIIDGQLSEKYTITWEKC